ncbi:MAG: TetR family transcriptional regulator C-terminal domain-containing protein [Desulfomonile tiedjei]|nr:TetR family transcriptional regulator C-terminal domain-containing protein [Desulfomonile tiedjei]
MGKDNTRTRLIEAGARLVHEKGFNHTGVQEILRACEVPKGSFYFYFQSKEEFGMAIVDHFSEFIGDRMDMHLGNESLPHVQRLKSFFDEMMEYFRHEGCARGCPIGNLAQELADLSNTFREKLKQALDAMEAKLGASLQAARDRNELPSGIDPKEAANFILNSWEGALTRMKTEKSINPLVVFDKMIFGLLLGSRVQ